MAYTLKQYAGFAEPTTLAVAIGPTDATIQGTNLLNYPDGSIGPFVIDLNINGATEEKILCSSRSGNILTVAASGRGYDGTTATSHSVNEVLNHVITAVDMTEANYAVTQTVGKVTTAGDLLVASGANALTRLGIGSNGQVLGVSGGAVGWISNTVGLIGLKVYAPSSHTYGITSATFSNVDSTNLALTFTAPVSGQVLVRFTATIACNSGGGDAAFAVALDGTLVTSTITSAKGNTTATTDLGQACTTTHVLSGLSAGSHTIKWQAAGGGTTLYLAQGANPLASTAVGPAIMEVWSA